MEIREISFGKRDAAAVVQPVSRHMEKVEEQGIVIVHCLFKGEGAIRIWRSTFLTDLGSNHRSRLIHAENISLYPQWTFVSNGAYTFTLYFEALPASCNKFDLREKIPQAGGFLVQGITRNNTDVYSVIIYE